MVPMEKENNHDVKTVGVNSVADHSKNSKCYLGNDAVPSHFNRFS